MFKKIIAVFILIVTLHVNGFAIDNSTLAFGKDFKVNESEKIETAETTKYFQKKELSENLDKKLSKIKNLKNPEMFKSIVNCNNRAKHNNISKYVEFICTKNLSDEQHETINRILEKGTTIQSLEQVFEFWLTTDEDFVIIEQICALEDTFFSVAWYESAFNYLTAYEHGALSGDEIIEYQREGISFDEILAANVLSRRKGQNIFSILDNMVNGISLEAQAMEIYGVDLLPEADNLTKKMELLAKNRFENAVDLFANVEVTDFAVDNSEIFSEVVKEKAVQELKRLNVDYNDVPYGDDYNALYSSKYPPAVQLTLLNKGYTPQEIKKASQMLSANPVVAAKMAREVMKNEK